jgi:hypothetical protein
MKKEIELYGVVTAIQSLEVEYYFTIKEDGTDKEYNVLVSEDNLDWELTEGGHYYVSGEFSLDVIVADYVDRWGRYCSHCGKHHEEGYWIGEHEYACSDECAIAILGGKEQFDEAMNEYEDDANYNPICWVEWYN